MLSLLSQEMSSLRPESREVGFRPELEHSSGRVGNGALPASHIDPKRT